MVLTLAWGPCAAAAARPIQAAPSAEGSIGLKLLDAPRGREADPRAHMYIVDHLAPGTVIHRRLQVTNTSDTDQRVDLYAASAAIDGGTFNADPDRTQNELTTWVSVDDCAAQKAVAATPGECGAPRDSSAATPSAPRSLVRDVPAHGTAVVDLSVRVPPKASAGERYAVVWAQVAGPADPAGNVRMVNRVGVRIYLDVGPGGEPPSDFQIGEVTPARAPDGTPEVVATVRNTGKRALDMTGSVSLADGPGSLSAGPFPASLGTTLGIGSTGRVTVLLDRQLPAGPWTVRLTLASGLVRHTVTATVTFPAGFAAGAPVTPHAVDSASMTAGVSAVALGAVVLAAFGYGVVRRRRTG
ncbi:peptidase [Kitasatospora sp. DSM 101779]|uniref:peptidase n=1 Tax=Kitasatospora sp. DSM 101779 TaxID=2853165 RepID=UPI0021DA12EA|nr:peptidase [Kitasatospora sp. DSM 101779]MCU7827133.1 peptidase [Kitasatospora sp. DSM 101779]